VFPGGLVDQDEKQPAPQFLSSFAVGLISGLVYWLFVIIMEREDGTLWQNGWSHDDVQCSTGGPTRFGGLRGAAKGKTILRWLTCARD
jgi:hypothetical protein